MSARSRAISRRASANTARVSCVARGLRSTRRTQQPPTANAIAICRPIRPGPRMATSIMGPRSRLPPVDHHDVLAHAAVVVREADVGVRHLARPCLVAELREDFGRLRDTGRAQGMAAADQAAARVDDDVAAIIAAPRLDEPARFTFLAEAE